MVQKKRHLIHGKSMVEVIYRKSSKSARKSTEPGISGSESNPILDPADQGNTRFKKTDKKAGMEFSS